MPHIHTEPGQHDYTVTGYIIRTDTPEPLALVHMHRKHHKLLPIGGHVELNESPWQAIAHELREESGYNLEDLMLLQPVSRIKHLSKVALHPYPLLLSTHDITAEHFHSDIAYGFLASSDPSGEINDTESTDLRWLTRADLSTIQDPDIYLNTKEAYEFMFTKCLKNWEKVATSAFQL